MKPCKDCLDQGVTTARLAPHPGPRCATHHRVWSKRAKSLSHERKVIATYGLESGDYERILAVQGGVCAGCGPRTGRNGRGRRRLAVDHNHATGQVRGLLCSDCNRTVGRFRDDPATFLRLAAYLVDPPAAQILGQAP